MNLTQKQLPVHFNNLSTIFRSWLFRKSGEWREAVSCPAVSFYCSS